MIDYLSIIKYTGKDTPFLEFCTPVAAYNTGWQSYFVEGCERMKIRWNPDTGEMKLQGSVLYFWQGHNFSCRNEDFAEAIEYLQRLLHLGLWDSVVEAFEFGEIFPVDHKPALYINQHHSRPAAKLIENQKGQDQGSCKWWEDRSGSERLKLYDAKKNILQKQGMKRRELIREAGWDPEANYLMFEVHFLKPHLINAGRNLLLEDLINPDRQQIFGDLLIEQYKLLEPMKTLLQPTNKKDLSSADILLQAYVEGFINAESSNPAGAQKALYKRINRIPEGILSKADKDNRKRQIKALFAKVKEAPVSSWDLTGQIAAAVDLEREAARLGEGVV